MLDVLVFAPHPDDAELGAGGAIIKAVRNGLKVGIIDLTAGEMGSKGTKKVRLKEAQESKKILGVDFRLNLELPDGHLPFKINSDTIFLITDKIREYQPKAILSPYWEDRHPDHIAASKLITKAVHYAKLSKVKTNHSEFLVETTIYYELNGKLNPSFMIDISDEFKLKKKAIMCFKSQFKSFSKEYLPFPVEERCSYYGSLLRKEYAEAFHLKEPLELKNLDMIF